MNMVGKLSIFANTLIAAGTLTLIGHSASAQEDMHAHHHMMMSSTKTSTVAYTVPAVTLVRDDGKTVALKDELDDGRPVVLTFIYTTCTSICPVISQTLSQFQHELGADRDKVHIVSISIDPENDTPARLREYAAKFGAGPEWQHYTGTVAASVVAQKAFNVYRQDKMDHNPVLLLRATPGKSWLRIDGFATADDLLHFYHSLIASD
ncbi:redoxin family protein [Burkholderia thailandensis MSMB121]|uniref:SCO family protein n=2 Tax=Burkholderia humptydooensis TaxID=430531 RepID=A0A7T2X275_9BURK|nr:MULTISPECIES: SCO family protein [Burkholderia]AGK50213.1 redoxin family protein [Burkholderia thailandensis MSMB121]ATF33131.1 SCO family protein [Burkholderia thailandensis]AJY39437.1 redoxin family protein [Burkholderia sp. 2002721687]EIP87180.1 electron transport protein SCO1/SenC [Burkholderia humptydooensis MSMB43]QPS47653.1 SCO family protein [Burkholderia humptydooensis]